MRFTDAIEDQHVKAVFIRITVFYDVGNSVWKLTGDGGISQTLSGATDQSTAQDDADTYLSGNSFLQVTYWSVIDPNTSRSTWVH